MGVQSLRYTAPGKFVELWQAFRVEQGGYVCDVHLRHGMLRSGGPILVNRGDLIRACGPLVAAIASNSFREIYTDKLQSLQKFPEQLGSTFKQVQSTRLKHEFIRSSGLTPINLSINEHGVVGARHLVDMRESLMVDDYIKPLPLRNDLRSFARAFTRVTESYRTVAIVDRQDYVRLDEIKHLDKALEALAHLKRQSLTNEDSALAADRIYWAAQLYPLSDPVKIPALAPARLWWQRWILG